MDHALRERIVASLYGTGAHVSPTVAVEGLTASQAKRRPSKKLATVWEELAHAAFWQDFALETLRGGLPQAPAKAADGWPVMPEGRGGKKAWEALKAHFAAGLAELEQLARTGDLDARVGGDGKSTLGEGLLAISQHTSYHVGQIVAVRRIMGAWPPPSGGVTW